MRSLRVLIVDREPAIRGLLSLVLTDAGHKIIGAVSAPEEAHSLSGRPDVVLIDAPDGANTSPLDSLREAFPNVPCCLMSASGPFTRADLRGRGLTLLAKPFTHKELLQALTEARFASDVGHEVLDNPDVSVVVHAPAI